MNRRSISLKILYASLLVIIILMPFHAFLTTWAGSIFGNREIWQAWKEIVIVIMSLIGVGVLAKDRTLRQKLCATGPTSLSGFTCFYI